MHSYDVRVWNIRKRPSKAAPFQLRWQVDGTEHQEKFATKTLADARRAELLTATRTGEPFDTETGLPVSEMRERNRTSWYAHAHAHAARKADRSGKAPREHRREPDHRHDGRVPGGEGTPG
ncbi:hypothetical protein [Streptomyces sp. SD15]